MEPTMQHTFYFKRKGYSTLHTHGHPNIRELVHGERMETGQQRRRKDAEREREVHVGLRVKWTFYTTSKHKVIMLLGAVC